MSDNFGLPGRSEERLVDQGTAPREVTLSVCFSFRPRCTPGAAQHIGMLGQKNGPTTYLLTYLLKLPFA